MGRVCEGGPEGRAGPLDQYIAEGPDHRLRTVILEEHRGTITRRPPLVGSTLDFQDAPNNRLT
jgi:hypothetical protein